MGVEVGVTERPERSMDISLGSSESGAASVVDFHRRCECPNEALEMDRVGSCSTARGKEDRNAAAIMPLEEDERRIEGN